MSSTAKSRTSVVADKSEGCRRNRVRNVLLTLFVIVLVGVFSLDHVVNVRRSLFTTARNTLRRNSPTVCRIETSSSRPSQTTAIGNERWRADDDDVNSTPGAVLHFVSTDKFHGYLVGQANDNATSFLDRIGVFNRALGVVRHRLLAQTSGDDDGGRPLRIWSRPELVWGADDDYIEKLARRHRHILTVALPWTTTTQIKDGVDSTTAMWNSLTDLSNVLVQRYYDWTADDRLCRWIESPGVIKMKYDAVYGRRCSRNATAAAAQPQSLKPVFLQGKPINRNHYWPNGGASYPARFYTDTPPFVFHAHVHRDAFIDDRGDVFSGDTVLALYLCRDSSTRPKSSLPGDACSKPIYDEVFTLSQMWGTGVFHRMVEVVPRIVVFLEFLRANPDIRIQVPRSDQLVTLFRIFGLDESRLVTGAVWARIAYQPRATGCGFANVQESQLTSKLYRDYIVKSLPRRTRDRIVLIRRSGARRFTEHRQIERALRSAAADYNLTFELFPDNPTPSLNATMQLFNSAVVVVGPHGAGLSNVLFSEPGTFVVEGVCNLPHVNLCFQRLVHVLGHRYHGVTSRKGCEGVVDVPATSVERAVRDYLRVWRDMNR